MTDREDYGFGAYVFRLACAYGLARTAPGRRRGEIVTYAEDDGPSRHPNWLWNRVRERWRRETGASGADGPRGRESD